MKDTQKDFNKLNLIKKILLIIIIILALGILITFANNWIIACSIILTILLLALIPFGIINKKVKKINEKLDLIDSIKQGTKKDSN